MRDKAWRLSPEHLGRLIALLAEQGYEVIGPRKEGAAIRWGPVGSLDDLPAGVGSESTPGHYRLRERAGPERFAWGPSPDSVKRWLHVPEARFAQASKTNGTFHILHEEPPSAKVAFLGLRPCDVAALERLDKVFMEDRFVEEHYAARRRDALFIAVNCTVSLETCFCASMECGPRAAKGFDIALTEHVSGGEAPGGLEYMAETGTARGLHLVEALGAPRAEAAFVAECREASKQAGASQSRKVDWRSAVAVMLRSFEHPRWEETAQRCLACANCTLSCPTCFCVNTIEKTSLDGQSGERKRLWDTCFTQSFTYIHGGSVRTSVKSRYRQWLGHKLAWWQQQFGTAGCTGCGRCIAWCPAGIDITEEFNELAGTAQGGKSV
ncbi:MAG: 4Fe-4S dicluster domain-containing protein [Bryobacteraceae bacterium]|jgi:ferredoxin